MPQTRNISRAVALWLTAILVAPACAIAQVAQATKARTAQPAAPATQAATPTDVRLECETKRCVIDLRGAAAPRLELGGGSSNPLYPILGTVAAGMLAAAAALAVARSARKGALATVAATSQEQRAEEERQTELRRRGILGLLADDLHRWEGTVVEAYYRNRWWDKDGLLAPRSDAEDLRRAVTALEPAEWRALGSARRWVDFLDVEAAAGVQPLEGDQARWLAETFYRLEAARWALERRIESMSSTDAEDTTDAVRQVDRFKAYRQERLRERLDTPLARDPDAYLTTLGPPGMSDECAGHHLGQIVAEGVSAVGRELLPARFRASTDNAP